MTHAQLETERLKDGVYNALGFTHPFKKRRVVASANPAYREYTFLDDSKLRVYEVEYRVGQVVHVVFTLTPFSDRVSQLRAAQF